MWRYYSNESMSFEVDYKCISEGYFINEDDIQHICWTEDWEEKAFKCSDDKVVTQDFVDGFISSEYNTGYQGYPEDGLNKYAKSIGLEVEFEGVDDYEVIRVKPLVCVYKNGDIEVGDLILIDGEDAIHYWDGRNWVWLWLDSDYYNLELEVSDEQYELAKNTDTWDGNNYTTGGIGLHGKYIKFSNGNVLFIQSSQWEGEEIDTAILFEKIEDMNEFRRSL